MDAVHPLIIDLDASLVGAHSEKEHAAPTYKKGFGFHPLLAFCDHGPGGTGEPLSFLLRPGNAGSNTATDHISVIRDALAQLPCVAKGGQLGRTVLIRTDGAGGTHKLLEFLTTQKLSYSVGFGLSETITAALPLIPASVWTPAYDAEQAPREGAWVAELTDLVDLSGWPGQMRLILRKERPHPGAQLRFTDADGLRLTAFVTNTRGGQLADLELRHRRRARCEDRIRVAKDTGMSNLPDVIFSRGVGRGADLRVCVVVGVLDVTRRRWGSALFNGFVAATSGRVAAGALPQDAAGPCISEGLGEGVA